MRGTVRTRDDGLRLVPSPMALLAQGVPLSLLLDLAQTGGPDSHRLLVEEGGSELSWLRALPGRRTAPRTRTATG